MAKLVKAARLKFSSKTLICSSINHITLHALHNIKLKNIDKTQLHSYLNGVRYYDKDTTYMAKSVKGAWVQLLFSSNLEHLFCLIGQYWTPCGCEEISISVCYIM